MDINDYVLKTCLFKDYHEAIRGECNNYTKINTVNYFGSKAFTFQLPEKTPMYAIVIKLKKSIFKGSVRPTAYNYNSLFAILLSFEIQTAVVVEFVAKVFQSQH